MTVNDTLRTGLIGWPVEHSVSPAMHNAAFAALGIAGRYELLPTPLADLPQRVASLRRDGFRGVNVTVPHKQAIIAALEGVTDAARAIGAVNTLLDRGGRWIGDNTDGNGFLAALQDAGFAPADKHALVLGAGGAARAVAYTLSQACCAVTLVNRTPKRARQLAADLRLLAHAAIDALDTPDAVYEVDLTRYHLLVNCTSVGMWPHVDDSPWPDDLALPASWTVLDLVYTPLETRLLASARASGAHAMDGLGMLVHQGALAFELWTGQAPPIAVMRAAAEEALTKRRHPEQEG